MKKLITLILTLISMLGLVSCHVNNVPYWDLSSATRIEIEIFDTQTGDSITVATNEQKDIENIISNLNSLELEKIEFNEPTVALYTLRFYNAENDHIESITISIDGWLTCEEYFHYVKSGNLDLDYLEQIASKLPQVEVQQILNPIVDIVDRTKTEGLPYDMAEEKFFEDGDNEYYFSGIYSNYVIVHYKDGSQEDIVTALNAGRATIVDLDKFEVDYIVKSSDKTISQTEAEEIALIECKVNYDYIKAEFDTDKNAWEIGFWEDNAVLAAQTILIDTTGRVLDTGYAE